MTEEDQDIVSAIKIQVDKHPDCMDRIANWRKYNDRPFTAEHICKKIGWSNAQRAIGVKSIRNKTPEEMIDCVKIQLKKHPDCLDSYSKWDEYKDRPFCAGALDMRIGWTKTKDSLGIKHIRMVYTDQEIFKGIEEQLRKHPRCLVSRITWDKQEDRPFPSSVFGAIGIKKIKEKFGLKYRPKRYSKEEIIEGVKSQFRRHPNCLNSSSIWNSYKDKPFCVETINRYIKWWKIREEIMGRKFRKQNHSEDEIIEAAQAQLKKHPDCMVSRDRWNGYEDKPFSAIVMDHIGIWTKCKVVLGVSLGNTKVLMSVLRPILLKFRQDSFALSDIFELINYTVKQKSNGRSNREIALRKILSKDQEFTEKDMVIAKKCFMRLANEWRQNKGVENNRK